MSAVDFLPFALGRLPPAPARVLEVGCGDEGGLVPEFGGPRLRHARGRSPRARGRALRAASFEDAAESLLGQAWDAVIAARVLHHVEPLDEGVALLAELAPVLLVDEFAPDRVVGAAQAWYSGAGARCPPLRGRRASTSGGPATAACTRMTASSPR